MTHRPRWYFVNPAPNQDVSFDPPFRLQLFGSTNDQAVDVRLGREHKDYFVTGADRYSVFGTLKDGVLMAEKLLSYTIESFVAVVGHVAPGPTKTVITAYINRTPPRENERRYINVPEAHNEKLGKLQKGDLVAVKGYMLETLSGHKQVNLILLKRLSKQQYKDAEKSTDFTVEALGK